jgi:hypothetical protein
VGLVNKFLRLHDFLSSVHVDIVSISETWLDSSVKDSEFVPNGYTICRQDTQGTYTQTKLNLKCYYHEFVRPLSE